MNKVVFGDCRDTMRELISQGVKVQMCVTSPPYFGLRSYGGGSAEIGLERTPDEYVANLVEVFSLVRDMLHDDGTLWLNLGDSYAANRGYQVAQTKGGPKHGPAQAAQGRPQKASEYGIKPKDLIGIPWRVAFALQADGWWLRQDIIWHKSNPMPESVTDRCTKAHEYVFLLSKSGRYLFDNEAIKEAAISGANGSSFNTGKSGEHQMGRSSDAKRIDAETRNKRSVWTITTKPYSGAHFATFPPALIETCILAGSRPGDTVLDPFLGSGTTGQVAQSLGRKWIGCELNPEYGPLQDRRTDQSAFVF